MSRLGQQTVCEAPHVSAAVPSLCPSLRAARPCDEAEKPRFRPRRDIVWAPAGVGEEARGPARGLRACRWGRLPTAGQPHHGRPPEGAGPGWGRVGGGGGATARSTRRGLTTVSRPHKRQVGMLETAGGRGHPESLRKAPSV